MTDAEIAELYPRTLRLARRFTIYDPAITPEDIAQTAWLKALPYLDIMKSPPHYLDAAVRNAAFDAMGRTKKLAALSLDAPLWGFDERPELPDSRDEMAETEARIALEGIVADAEAGNSFAAAALLATAYDCAYAADRLGIKVGSVRSRVTRYRKDGGAGPVFLTPGKVRAIREGLAAGTPRKHLAARYGKTVDIIDKIARGDIWKEVA